MIKESSAKNSLSTLDFVISVLREHEKELTNLSEQLDNVLTKAGANNAKHVLDELCSSVKTMSRGLEVLSEKVDATSKIDLGLSETIASLREESKKQAAQIDEMAGQFRALPTKKDVRELKKAIDALGALIEDKAQKTGTY